MMFNEYMDHANQCAGYYSVTRKEEISIQQSETNRFKQKWLEVSGNNYPPQAPQNPTPPPPGNSGPFNKNGYQQQQHGHIKQEPHAPNGGYMNNGQYANGQYKGPPPMKPPGMDGNQHMMRQQHPHHQYQQPQYQQPQFIPKNNSMKDNSNQQHMKQPQKRQSPSPMLPAAANNGYSQQQQHSYENPTKKFGMQHPLNNSTNSQVANNSSATGLKSSNSSHQLSQQQPANAPNGTNNNGNNNQKMYHSNPAMIQQQGNPNYPNMHPNMPHQNGYKPPYQQQPGPPQGNYLHHNQQQQQQQSNYQQQHPQQQLQQPKHSQQQSGPSKNQPYPGTQPQQHNLDLKSVPQRINSPIHSQPSPYPQIHSNGPVDNMNSPKDVNSNGFSKKLSSSSLVQQQQQQQPHNKPSPMDLPIKSPALPVRSTTPSIPMLTNDSQQQQLVQKSPVRLMTQSPSNSSLNTSICVPTPMNNNNLIDLNQDQLISDDCDSGSLLSPLNNTNTKMTTSLSFQNSKGSILSEINFDELFMHYPKVFEELFYSFKLNSIEQIEHELRSYCEQQFKLNFSKQNTNWSNSNASHQQSSIRI